MRQFFLGRKTLQTHRHTHTQTFQKLKTTADAWFQNHKLVGFIHSIYNGKNNVLGQDILPWGFYYYTFSLPYVQITLFLPSIY